ncbi:MAG: Fe-S cluster assembly protein SufD [Acidobacteriota bacterium]
MKNTLPGFQLISPLKKLKEGMWKNDEDWINSIRNKGESDFSATGLPGTDEEEWKYTDLSTVLKYNYNSPEENTSPYIISDDVKKIIPEKLSPFYLIFLNGNFSPELSTSSKKPDGIRFESIREELNRENNELKKFLETYSPEGRKNSIAALNSAYLNDGAFIKIERSVTQPLPLHLIYINTNIKEATINSPRNIIIAEENSSVSVIEEYIGVKNSKYFTNSRTEILLKKGSSLDHYKIQQESKISFHIGTIEVHQSKNSSFTSQTISFGSKISRNNIFSSMEGEKSESLLEGIYFVNEDQHIDNHTTVYHKDPSCKSIENFHGILDHEARAVFDGKIYVAKGAIGTDSVQSNRSLLLSDKATVDSKPTLEIYADDVKCAHSAAVGQLDEESVYYLRSRGIGDKDAKKILTTGFAKEITDKFKLKGVASKVEKILQRELIGS